MSEFDGKIVLITGCARARGMGRAISVAFARAGADVVVTDVAAGGTRNENEEGLEETRLGWKGLESLAGQFQTEWANYAAGSLLVCVPVMVLFVALNRWIVSGLSLGGVKG